ncbi:MAG TPA: FtsW/RodA/SpoVE family cell cycle protein [Fimbriimonadaceae bacterium]|nr:FtsW/RodA/SpoVE family cell cycle protein [Fimbriimonadaceae bacterium]
MAGIAQPRQYSFDLFRARRRYDWPLLLSAATLLLVGLLSLHSLDVATGSAHLRRQAIRIVIGLIPLSVMYFVPPKAWLRFATPLYWLNLMLLVSVLLIGKSGKGATRWIDLGPIEFQPSELAKLLTVLTLSAFLFSRLGEIRRLKTFLLGLVHVAAPLALVFAQPHLGATLVIVVTWLGVSLAAGVPIRYLGAGVLIVIAGLGLAWNLPGVLKPYQRERVEAMFSPDEKGNAFQPVRAQIAFGLGGVTGAGYLQGDQKKGKFIPEQHNDFIFTVVGEEGGLIGSALVIFLFGFFFYRAWLVVVRAEDRFHKMVAAGVFSVFTFHTIVNLGMNLQLLPVVGLWLPFMSYGGTAIWLCMAGVGLLLNIRNQQEEAVF